MDPAPSRSLRLFVALAPPEPIRRRLLALQAELRRAAGAAAAEVRWVAPENVHLTLQFLGGVPEERRAAVEAALTAAAAATPPFHLDVHGAGAFPSGRRARVLWAGVGGELEVLGGLATDLGRRLAALGYASETRPFAAHLTLGRARDPRGVPGLAAALARCAEGPSARWAVEEAVLFRSHLSPHGPRYEALARPRLGTAAPRT